MSIIPSERSNPSRPASAAEELVDLLDSPRVRQKLDQIIDVQIETHQASRPPQERSEPVS